jgi:outer membrane receptor for ferrienterochelin and colicins
MTRRMVNGFWMLNLSVSRSFSNSFNIQGGTENLLNYTNPVQLSNIAGRLFFININYSFANKHDKHKNEKQ